MRSEQEAVPPSMKERISALSGYLREFERPEFYFARWERHNGEFESCVLHPVAEKFIEELHRSEWVIPRRWPEWRDEARMIHQNPGLLEEASIDTIKRILSAHVLADRIKEGHLLTLFEEGHLQAILKRLERIGDGL